MSYMSSNPLRNRSDANSPTALSTFGVFFVALLMAMPLQVRAQTPQSEDNSRFVVFIHAGGGSAEVGKKVALELGRRGYVVRKPDNQRDTVGGPGVDYFNAEDAQAAKEVATVVNSIVNPKLPTDSNGLQARLQRVKNPLGYLGVWLF